LSLTLFQVAIIVATVTEPFLFVP